MQHSKKIQGDMQVLQARLRTVMIPYIQSQRERVDSQDDPGRQRAVDGLEVVQEPVVLGASNAVVGIWAQEDVVRGAHVHLHASTQALRRPPTCDAAHACTDADCQGMECMLMGLRPDSPACMQRGRQACSLQRMLSWHVDLGTREGVCAHGVVLEAGGAAGGVRVLQARFVCVEVLGGDGLLLDLVVACAVRVTWSGQAKAALFLECMASGACRATSTMRCTETGIAHLAWPGGGSRRCMAAASAATHPRRAACGHTCVRDAPSP